MEIGKKIENAFENGGVSPPKEYILGPGKEIRMFQSDGVEKRFQIGRLR